MGIKMEKFTEMINAIAEVMENNLPFAFPRIAVGIIFGIITAVVIIGGIKSIAVVCEKLVPFMAAFYVLGCIVILGINADYILPAILVIGIITFAYSTILGWSYYGERAAEYLLGRKAILLYKVIFTAIVVLGPVLALDLVWTIADVLNALMAIPNLVAVLLLSGVIAKETRHYLANLDEKDTTEIPVVRR